MVEIDEERVKKLKDKIIENEIKKEAASGHLKKDKHWKIKLALSLAGIAVGLIWFFIAIS